MIMYIKQNELNININEIINNWIIIIIINVNS